MSQKTCFKCQVEKSLSDFYPHPRMADGHLNKCKECTRRDARENRALRRVQYSDYERDRARRPSRKRQQASNTREFRRRHPVKLRAWNAVARAKKKGALVPEPCRHCGTRENVQAHHPDYTMPLFVIWVCFRCHREEEHGQVVVSSI